MLHQLKKYKPLTDRVLVRRHNTSGFAAQSKVILAPETQINKSIYCTVIASGKLGKAKVKSDLEPGMVVVLRQWSGDSIDALFDEQVLSVNYQLIEAIDTEELPDRKALDYAEQLGYMKALIQSPELPKMLVKVDKLLGDILPEHKYAKK